MFLKGFGTFDAPKRHQEERSYQKQDDRMFNQLMVKTDFFLHS